MAEKSEIGDIIVHIEPKALGEDESTDGLD